MSRLPFVKLFLIILLTPATGYVAGLDSHHVDESWVEQFTSSTLIPITSDKIQFDLDRLDASGLQGPPDGLSALHYEYCIPDREDAIRKIMAIDPTLQIQRHSPGRVGCSEDELLCLGHTHQPEYRSVLKRLAALSLVREVREVFFE